MLLFDPTPLPFPSVGKPSPEAFALEINLSVDGPAKELVEE